MKLRIFFLLNLLLTLPLFLSGSTVDASRQAPSSGEPTLTNPILFVAQVPIASDFTTIGSTFGNHLTSMQSVGRGGDLWIRYPDGTKKNLTAAAGYGHDGFQGSGAIAVRDPAVHWSGAKALFSMVIGAPTEQFKKGTYYWQLYEITGLAQNETPVISQVPNQPENFNNISPIYGTDDRIIFTTDRPRNGARHLYPQLDEYELAPTNTGLWRLDPTTGDLELLNHAPSGDFTPIIDSFGRVVFTQWDHLQRDQQADDDALTPAGDPLPYGTFNYSDESANATVLDERSEVFPEPRDIRTDLLAGTNLAGHRFNHFFPWMINQDGTEGEVLNHLGRHELHDYLNRSIVDDENVIEYYGQYTRVNPNPLRHMLQIKEDPRSAGLYYGSDVPEFGTHAAGQIISLGAPPTTDADHISVTYVTHRDTANPADNPSTDHSGLYRDPLPLSDGTLIAVHTAETRADANDGSRANPQSRYDFRLKMLTQAANGHFVADQPLTSGISKSISYWDPDVLVSYSGPLWELQPVEVRVRERPTATSLTLAEPEQEMFDQAGVNVADLQAYLVQNNLALAVSRDVTSRDDLDKQQPFNLRVAGASTQTIGAEGHIYDVAYMQFFQADQVRGWRGGGSTIRAGRRVLAQVMHDTNALANNPSISGPESSVIIASDGSMAAFVPARRAMTWQLTDNNGTSVVRERYWLTFQPGEIRVCASCHGLSERDQAGQTAPTNSPQALLQLLEHWQTIATPIATSTPTPTAAPTSTPTPSATVLEHALYLPLMIR